MKRPEPWLFALAIGALCVTAARTAAAVTGDYTTVQAAAGAAVYTAKCASCHGQKLEGVYAPPLVGAAFKHSLDTTYKTAADLNDFVSKQMPLNDPGSLKEADYLAVEAYLLSKNGFPDGSVALSSANASSVPLASAETSASTAPSPTPSP